MAIVKQKNRKTGVTYVYESYSYRDKETKQPRAIRKLIGRLDESTGEVVPTRRKQKSVTTSSDSTVVTKGPADSKSYATLLASVQEKDEIIKSLRAEIARLQRDRTQVSRKLTELAASMQE